MRKSLLLTLEFPPQKGGTQTYYFNICQNLPSDKIVVLSQKFIKSIKSKVEEGFFDNSFVFKIYCQNLLSKFIWPHWLPMVWYLWRIIKKEQIELVQVGQVLPCGTVALVIKKIFKIPYIVYTHGLDILNQQNNPRKLKLIKKILNEAEKVVSNSEFTRREVLKFGVDGGKTAVVYPCVVTPQPPLSGGLVRTPTQPNETELVGNSESHPDKGGWGVLMGGDNKHDFSNKIILLTVCRLVDRKGVDNVLRALHGVKDQVENLAYVIVGDGPERLKLEKLAKELFDDDSRIKIIFTGRVSDEELSELYNLSDIFILTPKQSKFDVEGFGTVYLEANSYGKPVIGSKMSGIVEAVVDGETGLLVEPNNISDTGKSIIKLFNDESLRTKLGEQGRERVEKEFRIEKQIEKIIRIIG